MGILKRFLQFKQLAIEHMQFSSQKFKCSCASSVLWLIYLKHLLFDAWAVWTVCTTPGAQSYQKPLGPTEILIMITGKSTKPSPVSSHARNRDTKERGEKHVLAGWILGAFSSQRGPTDIQTKHRQGSLWPTFPPSHRVLCHCETATEFQLHNDDERDFKRSHTVRLTVQWQPLPSVHAFCQGASAVPGSSCHTGQRCSPPGRHGSRFTQQPIHVPRTAVSPSFPTRSLSDCTEVSCTSSLSLKTFTLLRPLPPPCCLTWRWPCH